MGMKTTHANHPIIRGHALQHNLTTCKTCIFHGSTTLWLSLAHFVNSHRPFCFVASHGKGACSLVNVDHVIICDNTTRHFVAENSLEFAHISPSKKRTQQTIPMANYFIFWFVFFSISLFTVRLFTKEKKRPNCTFYFLRCWNVPTNVSHFPHFFLLFSPILPFAKHQWNVFGCKKKEKNHLLNCVNKKHKWMHHKHKIFCRRFFLMTSLVFRTLAIP